ncbi:hypothetical protein KKF05_02810 [Patescibacteria group bacterium]|nr:hypothetical protein [Patescibacteria group bacterium]MBU1029249.1 hypothetical protein [Patescibacteria group bacterium]MBU1915977.1 hypothetical protein [Patescibacteria group bacterium]
MELIIDWLDVSVTLSVHDANNWLEGLRLLVNQHLAAFSVCLVVRPDDESLELVWDAVTNDKPDAKAIRIVKKQVPETQTAICLVLFQHSLNSEELARRQQPLASKGY